MNLWESIERFIALLNRISVIQNGLWMSSVLSARRTCLEELDSVHNVGMRYAKGHLALTLHKSYIVKQEWRCCMRYVDRMLSLPNLVCDCETQTYKNINRRCTLTGPAGTRALEIAWRYNIQAPIVQVHVPCEVSPWLLRKPHCRVYVGSWSKGSSNPT